MDDPRKGSRAYNDAGLAARVTAARRNAGYTQEAAAEKIDVSMAMLAAIEQGRRGASLWMLQQMARVYGVDQNYLTTGQSPAAPGANEHIASLVAALTPEPERIQRVVVNRVLELLKDLKAAQP